MCFKPHRDEEETRTFLANTEAEWNKDKPEYYEFAILLTVSISAASVYILKTEWENWDGSSTKTIRERALPLKPQKPLSTTLQNIWEQLILSPTAIQETLPHTG